MAENTDPERPDDAPDFAELLRRLIGGGLPEGSLPDGIDPSMFPGATGGLFPGASGGSFDAAEFERLTGMKLDPAMMAAAMAQLQRAFQGDGGLDWSVASQRARQLAGEQGLSVTDDQQRETSQAFTLAALWLGEATTVSELAEPGRAISRERFVELTMPVWQELAEPVATSIADALTGALAEQTPEELQQMIQGAGRVMRTIGGSLFAAQLGQVIGSLSREVLSGGEVGIPVMPVGEAALLPQNLASLAGELEVEPDQLALYLAVRELAHARLFRHAKWLRLHVISQVRDYARGISVDTSAIEDLAGRFDPQHPEELRSMIESGALLPRNSETQLQALARLETLLATIEGWVDVVTVDATARLPRASAIAESIRRRRATGGPAEQALGSLVGLELRPRRLREAAKMWRALTDAVGIEARDALWDYPDFLPTSADIDEPGALIARVLDRRRDESDGASAPLDEIDEAIMRILAGEEPSAEPSAGDESGTVDEPGTGDDEDRPGAGGTEEKH